MWAALLACAMSNWIQEITGIDDGCGRARRTLAPIRRELINIPRPAHPIRPTIRPAATTGNSGPAIRHVLTTVQALPTIRAG